MKYIATIIIVLLSTNLALAQQEYKIPAQNTKDGKLILTDFPGDIPIEGYNGNDIVIISDRDNEPPAQAKGLKPVYAAGTDNSGIGVNIEKEGNQFTVRCLLPVTQSANYRIKVPENFSLKVRSGCEKSSSVTIQNIKNEIEVNICHNITLKKVTGPVVLSSISGNITVVFSELSKDKPISIASVSGEVDVTIPANAPVDVEMGTVSGNMYSDFDFSTDKKQMRRVGGSNVTGQLNGGGSDLKITNVSGNIYLRKGQQ